MFLRYSWESVLDYKESVLQEAVSIEQTVKVKHGVVGDLLLPFDMMTYAIVGMKNFCQTVKALRRQDTLAQAAAKAATNTTGALPKHNLHDAEKQLIASLDATQERVHRHLCDNINTPAVMLELMAVVSKANVYVRERPTGGNVDVLERVARYITKMFKVRAKSCNGVCVYILM